MRRTTVQPCTTIVPSSCALLSLVCCSLCESHSFSSFLEPCGEPSQLHRRQARHRSWPRGRGDVHARSGCPKPAHYLPDHTSPKTEETSRYGSSQRLLYVHLQQCAVRSETSILHALSDGRKGLCGIQDHSDMGGWSGQSREAPRPLSAHPGQFSDGTRSTSERSSQTCCRSRWRCEAANAESQSCNDCFQPVHAPAPYGLSV